MKEIAINLAVHQVPNAKQVLYYTVYSAEKSEINKICDKQNTKWTPILHDKIKRNAYFFWLLSFRMSNESKGTLYQDPSSSS